MLSTARKSLLATAVIAAAACATSPVSASDVTISGIMDLGLQVRHTSHETATTMESGSNKSSVVDINAKEDLENGLHAGVYLSSRISADTGSMFNSPILFDQSTVNLGGDFGDFYLGRMGALKSPDGKMSAFALTQGFSPMASNMLGTGLFCVFKTDGTLNNAVGYRSPKLAGHQISLQYSNGTTTEVGDSQKDDRLFSTAVTYNNGTRLRYGAIYTYHTHKTIDVDQRATQDLMVSATTRRISTSLTARSQAPCSVPVPLISSIRKRALTPMPSCWVSACRCWAVRCRPYCRAIVRNSTVTPRKASVPSATA